MLEKLFKLKEHNTTVKTEIIAGITTFFAMAYIIFVNPNFLSQTGMDFNAVMMATCLAAALGTLLTAFMANVPFAQAPGMGLNAFFTYSVCMGMGYTWQNALAIVMLSGLIFFAVSVSPLQDYCGNSGVPEERDQRRYRPVHCPDRHAQYRYCYCLQQSRRHG